MDAAGSGCGGYGRRDLQPAAAALDQLGLAAALVETAGQVGGVAVVVDAPFDLPALPAAVEVAAYRIAEDDDTIFAALRAGARGYLLKGARRYEALAPFAPWPTGRPSSALSSPSAWRSTSLCAPSHGLGAVAFNNQTRLLRISSRRGRADPMSTRVDWPVKV